MKSTQLEHTWVKLKFCYLNVLSGFIKIIRYIGCLIKIYISSEYLSLMNQYDCIKCKDILSIVRSLRLRSRLI